MCGLDASLSPEEDELFDVDKDQSDDSTEPTDVKDLVEDDENDEDIDFNDKLFGGNTHPPEYYRWWMEDFDDSESDGEDYSLRGEAQFNEAEGLWQQCVVVSTVLSPLRVMLMAVSIASFCTLIIPRDPEKCFKTGHRNPC